MSAATTLRARAAQALTSKCALTVFPLNDLRAATKGFIIADETLVEILDTCNDAIAAGALIDPVILKLWIDQNRQLYLTQEADHEPARSAA